MGETIAESGAGGQVDAKFSTSSKHETRKESTQGKMGGMEVTGVGKRQ